MNKKQAEQILTLLEVETAEAAINKAALMKQAIQAHPILITIAVTTDGRVIDSHNIGDSDLINGLGFAASALQTVANAYQNKRINLAMSANAQKDSDVLTSLKEKEGKEQ